MECYIITFDEVEDLLMQVTKDKTLLDYVKNKANEGCRDLPLASARTLYPRLTFVDDEGMQELCKSMPTCLRNELAADLLLNEEKKPTLADKKELKSAIFEEMDSDIFVSDVSWSDSDRHLFLSGQ